MKRVKKSLVLALSMTVLMTCVLSGCGSKEAPTVSASASSASAETEWEKFELICKDPPLARFAQPQIMRTSQKVPWRENIKF